MLEQANDEQEIIQRVAALDIGKAELACCTRVPNPKGGSRRVQEVKTYSMMTRSLQQLADRLLDLGVTRVVMEATSDYWRSAFYLMEAHGFETWLVNWSWVPWVAPLAVASTTTDMDLPHTDGDLLRRTGTSDHSPAYAIDAPDKKGVR